MAFAWRGLFGERSLTKLVGVYGQQAQADAVAARLAGVAGLQPGQVRVLGPDDARRSRRDFFGRAVEPEVGGIFRTLVRTHVVTGIVGVIVGVLLYALLLGRDQPMVVGSPWLSFLAIVGFATTFGLMVGGLLSLRPDHALLIHQVRRHLLARRWALVVHPTDPRQADAVRQVLHASGAQVLTTL